MQFLASSEDILDCFLFIMSLHGYLGTWVWFENNSTCLYLVLSLLGDCLFLDFYCLFCYSEDVEALYCLVGDISAIMPRTATGGYG